MSASRPCVAVIDYGMGNLFSVKHACEAAGLTARITSLRQDVEAAQAVILPGVGAFGDAMEALRQRRLVEVLKETARSDKPLVGICLGMQLLMSESEEFGSHPGLDIVKGRVVRLHGSAQSGRTVKVPQVGWNCILRPEGVEWTGSLLDETAQATFFYFVHSFHVRPEDPRVVLSVTEYGEDRFCSSLAAGNVFGCQFHPERSGAQGLRVYQRLAARLKAESEGEPCQR